MVTSQRIGRKLSFWCSGAVKQVEMTADSWRHCPPPRNIQPHCYNPQASGNYHFPRDLRWETNRHPLHQLKCTAEEVLSAATEEVLSATGAVEQVLHAAVSERVLGTSITVWLGGAATEQDRSQTAASSEDSRGGGGGESLVPPPLPTLRGLYSPGTRRTGEKHVTDSCRRHRTVFTRTTRHKRSVFPHRHHSHQQLTSIIYYTIDILLSHDAHNSCLHYHTLALDMQHVVCLLYDPYLAFILSVNSRYFVLHIAGASATAGTQFPRVHQRTCANKSDCDSNSAPS